MSYSTLAHRMRTYIEAVELIQEFLQKKDYLNAEKVAQLLVPTMEDEFTEYQAVGLLSG